MVGVWQEKPPAAEGCRFKDFRFGAFINRCTLKCIKWTSEKQGTEVSCIALQTLNTKMKLYKCLF